MPRPSSTKNPMCRELAEAKAPMLAGPSQKGPMKMETDFDIGTPASSANADWQVEREMFGGYSQPQNACASREPDLHTLHHGRVGSESPCTSGCAIRATPNALLIALRERWAWRCQLCGDQTLQAEWHVPS